MIKISTIIDPSMKQNMSILTRQHEKAAQLRLEGDLVEERDITLITGETGTGKSTLLRLWTNGYPQKYGAQSAHIPVIAIKVDVHPSIGDLHIKLLQALNIPEPARMKPPERKATLHGLIKGCGITTIVFDEANHFADRSNTVVIANAADALKLFLEETRLHAVLAGTPSIEGLLARNEQLHSRTTRIIRLEPLECRTELGLRHAQQFISMAVEQLGFPEKSDLHKPEIVVKIIAATVGSKRRVVHLLKNAAHLAELECSRKVTLSHLADAYEFMPRVPGVKKNVFR